MKQIKKKLMASILMILMLFTCTEAFAAGYNNPELVSVQLKKNSSGIYDRFEMSWQNPEWVQKKLSEGEAVTFEIDGKVNYKPWSSSKGHVFSGTLTKDQGKSVRMDIPSNALPHLSSVDITSNLYSFRVRYKLGKEVSSYSAPVAVGFRPGFSNASEWSMEELTSAGKNGFIPASIKADMKKDITREEFTEVIVRVYEKVSRVHLAAGNSPFKDTNNEAVTIASRLGIVSGVGHGNFDPHAKITRQDMAAILNRFLKTLDIEGDSTVEKPFKDHNQIKRYAIESVYSLQSMNVFSGYKDNTFRPLTNASREQGVVLGERIYHFVNLER